MRDAGKLNLVASTADIAVGSRGITIRNIRIDSPRREIMTGIGISPIATAAHIKIAPVTDICLITAGHWRHPARYIVRPTTVGFAAIPKARRISVATRLNRGEIRTDVARTSGSSCFLPGRSA